MDRETEILLIESVATISDQLREMVENMGKMITIVKDLQDRVKKLETKNFWGR
jgi:CheY-like chemotaxis protein